MKRKANADAEPAESRGRRGSPEVVEKRRAARLFNDLLLGRRPGASDGRTARRRQRLLDELAAGTSRAQKRQLTPIDILTRVQALLELGEPIASIRRVCSPRPPAAPTPELLEGVRRLHGAYRFPLEAYAFVGIGEDILRRAGVVEKPGVRTVKAATGERLARGKTGRRGAA